MAKNPGYKILIIFGAIAFFVFAASYQGVPLRSSLQADFETWLSGREEQFRLAPSSFETGSVINLHVLSASRTHPLSVYLRAASRPEAERVFRILGLMREANIFSISKWRGDETNWPGVSLLIEDGGRIFRTQLDQREIEAAVQIKTMLKLLQVFAATPLPTPDNSSLPLENLETEKQSAAESGE